MSSIMLMNGQHKPVGALALKSGHCGSRKGAVAMEVVVLSVLVAVAVLIAVVVFGQTIIRNADVAERGMVGKGSNAASAQSCPINGYQKQVSDDVKEAAKFPNEFSDAN